MANQPVQCRECHALVYFLRQEKNGAVSGSLNPINAEPHPGGNIDIDLEKGSYYIYGKDVPANRRLHTSHFATCTNPDRFRKDSREGSPVRYELASLQAQNERLREALAQWKCSVCRGNGEAFNSKDEMVPCEYCNGTGIHTIARSVLDDKAITSLVGGVDVGIADDIDRETFEEFFNASVAPYLVERFGRTSLAELKIYFALTYNRGQIVAGAAFKKIIETAFDAFDVDDTKENENGK